METKPTCIFTEILPLDVVKSHLIPLLDVVSIVRLASSSKSLQRLLLLRTCNITSGTEDDNTAARVTNTPDAIADFIWEQLCKNKWKSMNFSTEIRLLHNPKCSMTSINSIFYTEYAFRSQQERLGRDQMVKNEIDLETMKTLRRSEVMVEVAQYTFEEIVKNVALDDFLMESIGDEIHGDYYKGILVARNRYQVIKEFQKLLSSSGGKTAKLEDGAFLITRFFHDASDLALDYHSLLSNQRTKEQKVNDEIDEMAAHIRELVSKDTERSHPIMLALKHMKVLFGQSEDQNQVYTPFNGNAQDYYNPHNSLLDKIIETRKGIPISLSVIYSAIIRRAIGYELDCIGMPGHFLLSANIPNVSSGDKDLDAATDQTTQLFIDAFREGRFLTLDQCKVMVRGHQTNFSWSDSFVDPIEYRDVWTRMLRNLFVTFQINPQESAQDMLVKLSILYGSLINASTAMDNEIDNLHMLSSNRVLWMTPQVRDEYYRRHNL